MIYLAWWRDRFLSLSLSLSLSSCTPDFETKLDGLFKSEIHIRNPRYAFPGQLLHTREAPERSPSTELALLDQAPINRN